MTHWLRNKSQSNCENIIKKQFIFLLDLIFLCFPPFVTRVAQKSTQIFVIVADLPRKLLVHCAVEWHRNLCQSQEKKVKRLMNFLPRQSQLCLNKGCVVDQTERWNRNWNHSNVGQTCQMILDFELVRLSQRRVAGRFRKVILSSAVRRKRKMMKFLISRVLIFKIVKELLHKKIFNKYFFIGELSKSICHMRFFKELWWELSKWLFQSFWEAFSIWELSRSFFHMRTFKKIFL